MVKSQRAAGTKSRLGVYFFDKKPLKTFQTRPILLKTTT